MEYVKEKHNIHPVILRKHHLGVLVEDGVGEWFKTTVGVRQGCLLSPVLFNPYLEQIMTLALEDFEGTVAIGGWNIRRTSRPYRTASQTSSAFGMEISAPKINIMITSANDTGQIKDTKVGDVVLDRVREFKYLGCHISEDAISIREEKTRLAIATQQLSKFKKIWA